MTDEHVPLPAEHLWAMPKVVELADEGVDEPDEDVAVTHERVRMTDEPVAEVNEHLRMADAAVRPGNEPAEVPDELGRLWTAPAERSDDGAFARAEALDVPGRAARSESGVASDLPPPSRTRHECAHFALAGTGAGG